jgi:hypothetical protein
MPTECLRGMLLGDWSVSLTLDPSPYLKLGEENKYLLFNYAALWAYYNLISYSFHFLNLWLILSIYVT